MNFHPLSGKILFISVETVFTLHTMSTFKRLERLAKSLMPKFTGHKGRHYSHDDVRLILTGLGMQMAPADLAYLTDTPEVLEDFMLSLYALEQKIGKRAVTDMLELDEELNPKVYKEEQTLGIAITFRGKEMLMAEYQLPA